MEQKIFHDFDFSDFWDDTEYSLKEYVEDSPRIGHFNIKSLKLAFFASFNDLNVINKLVSLNC